MVSFHLSLSLALLLFATQAQSKLLEPWVEHIRSVFSSEDCTKIIDAAEHFGFPDTADSIDYDDKRSTVSWAIDVMDDGVVEAPAIASLYQKYLPTLRKIVADWKFIMNNGDTTEPSLDWVFLRKYSAGEERKMLKLHQDVNLFTLNIALNGVNDYQGGGLFYQKNHDTDYEEGNPLPDLSDEIVSYDTLETVERQNTTERVFPDLQTGDLLMHNHTLYHAIAPLTNGTRYSLVFFYDMNHPHVVTMNSKEVDLTIENYFEMPVDLYLVDPESAVYKRDLVVENLDEEHEMESYTDNLYEVVNRETGEVLESFEIEAEVDQEEVTVVVGKGEDEDEEEDDEEEDEEDEEEEEEGEDEEEDEDEDEEDWNDENDYWEDEL